MFNSLVAITILLICDLFSIFQYNERLLSHQAKEQFKNIHSMV